MPIRKKKSRPVTGRPSATKNPRSSKNSSKQSTPGPLTRATAQKAWEADAKKSVLEVDELRAHGWRLKSPKQTQELTRTAKFPGTCGWSYQIVYYDIYGKKTKYYRVRYLEENLVFGQRPEKPRRYSGPEKHKARLRLYFSLAVDYSHVRGDELDELLLIVEGEKKAECAAKDGFSVVGIGGVSCWMQDGKPLPDWDKLNIDGRNVVLFFDSDYRDNPQVERQLIRLARELKRRGAMVFRANPPNDANGEKQGYDDCRKNLGKRATVKIIADAEEVEFPPDKIADLNEIYYVAPEGPNVRIYDERDGTAYPRHDFCLLYANQYVKSEDKNKKDRPLGEAWIAHPQRRQYTQTIFDPAARPDPNVYNRYKGFAYEPAPGDWSLLREHILDVICSGNVEYYEFTLDWMARGVQLPGERAEVAVVLRGPQGTGKGMLANTYAKLFAPHAYHASSAIEVTGRFSGHLKDVLFVFMDEAFFAGDKSHIGTLKRLITEPTIPIEEKFKQLINVRNRLKIIIASNEGWVIPAGFKERRFFVLDVSAEKQQDVRYFGALVRQLENGGYQALLHDLLQRDISRFDFRTCPRTDALADQQLSSMTPVESYWHGILEDGVIPYAKGETKFDATVSVDWGSVRKKLLYNDFVESQRQRGQIHLPDVSQFALELGRLLPDGYPKTHRPRINDARPYVWEFPSLEACREHFAAVRGGPTPKRENG